MVKYCSRIFLQTVGIWPPLGTMPGVGLCPNIPLKRAGMRMDPAVSEANPITDPAAAIMLPSPPDDPPDVRLVW